jgi:hypothetical protein
MKTQNLGPKLAPVLFLFASMLLACDLGGAVAPPPSKPVVSIGSPAHGAQVNVGQEVLVQASAVDASGIVRVELWVNGQLHSVAQPPSPQSSHAAVLRWTPATAGAYTLVAKAINVSSITSEPAAIAINVVGEGAPTTTPSAAPSATLTKPAVTVTVAAPAACVNDAAFVENVTVPDGTNWAAGQAFNKIWRVHNTGTCGWGPGYEFVFVGGEAMTTQSTLVVPVTAPGSTADLLVAMIAPTTPGSHAGQWRLRHSKSGLFGATMTVKVNVLNSAPSQGSQPPAQPPGPSCPGAPTIASFSANPTTITAGQSSALSWGQADNADSAGIDQGIGGVATPGNANIKPDKTTTYTLAATGCGGTVTKQVTITVNPSSGILPLLPVMPLLPLIPKGDVIVQDVFLSTQNEVIARIAVEPSGSLTGSYTWKVFANGAQVAQHSFTLPTGSQAYWSGYKVSGTQTIRVVVEIADLNLGNNEATKTCYAASHTCQ